MARLGISLAFTAAYLVLFAAVITVAVIAPGVNASRDTRTAWLIGSIITTSVLLIAGAAAWGLYQIFRRSRWLDKCFNPLGLTGQPYLLSGRQYHGSFQGRSADIYFMRGPVLEIFLSAHVHTRLAVGDEDALAARLQATSARQSFAVPVPGSTTAWTCSAHDPSWAHSFLAQAEIRQELARLLQPASGDYPLRHVYLQPGSVVLRLRHIKLDGITPEHTAAWLADLAALARAAENFTQPAERLETKPLERPDQANRTAINRRVAVITLAAVALMAVCLTSVILLLLQLEGF